MLNTNRVRGIMRARNGSQIPKFKLPAGPIINNDELIGSTEARPFKPLPTTKDLINVTTPLDLTKLSLPKFISDRYKLEKEALDKIANEKAKIKAAKGLANGTHTVSNGEVVYDFKGLVIDPLMDKAGDLLSDVGDISKKYPEMVGTGIDLIGNQFNDVENSSGVDTVFDAADTVTNGLMSVNPAVGLIGKAALTAFKGINSLGGKYSDSFSVNLDTIALVGGSYGGSVADINNAASKAGKKYGLFSGGARRDANRQIAEARRQQNIMTGIADEASMQKAMSGNDLNYLNYNFNLSGGYDLRYMRAAKSGMKFLDKIDFVKNKTNINSIINLDTKEVEWVPIINDYVEEFKEGGKLEEFEWEPIIEDLWEPVIDIFQKGGKTRTLEELIEYAKKENPRFIQRLSEDSRGIEFIDDEGNKARGSHYLEYSELDDGAIVYPRIQEVNGELKHFLDWREALKNALNNNNVLKMTPEEAILFSKDYKQGWPKFFFKEVYDYYKDYDLSNAILIRDNLARTEGNKIYVNNDEDAVHELWHFLSQNKPNEKYKEFYDNLNDDRITELGGDLNFVKRHEGDPGHFYHPSELEARIMAAKFKSLGQTYTKDFFKNLRSNENHYGYNMRDLLYMFNDENLEKIFNLKKGGALGEELETPEIEETNQKNLIPEGALHKNKHHMEHTEGLTLKGIPVIDNDGEQLAEIELDEIIFTLEVTKKLEELYKEGTDEAAIEAGKLLVKEILFNTDDRTGLIAKCEKGGKIE